MKNIGGLGPDGPKVHSFSAAGGSNFENHRRFGARRPQKCYPFIAPWAEKILNIIGALGPEDPKDSYFALLQVNSHAFEGCPPCAGKFPVPKKCETQVTNLLGQQTGACERDRDEHENENQSTNPVHRLFKAKRRRTQKKSCPQNLSTHYVHRYFNISICILAVHRFWTCPQNRLSSRK